MSNLYIVQKTICKIATGYDSSCSNFIITDSASYSDVFNIIGDDLTSNHDYYMQKAHYVDYFISPKNNPNIISFVRHDFNKVRADQYNLREAYSLVIYDYNGFVLDEGIFSTRDDAKAYLNNSSIKTGRICRIFYQGRIIYNEEFF